ncbi:MAG TPA: SprT family zinc-dependent metalloprotease [Defluviitaleaceae bacterium]|nr:SprT family zinc-dependent metalloprotease [Defluviitaleaceae bacterium]HPT76047.1 SprT family zinc-dependent metalloprotease [Defluviitaleaceae bacterium]HQD49923.1 SprT family zinc-dependent metalloprotease [Defluviitaleaceae bacterium]
MTKVIIIDDIRIEVVKKKIKNIYLYVHPPNGKVKISAPLKMKDEAIRNFVISKLAWIKKQQAKFQAQEGQAETEYVSGERHYYQGIPYILNVMHTNKKQRVEISKKQINLFIRPDSTKEQRERILLEWYRSELKKQIPGLISKWENIIGVKVNSWGVKLMKTRWGTCNPKAKRIWINLELAKKSPRCLEYIIVHEMVHLLEKHHNKRFYAFMKQFLPNWREIKAELNGLKLESPK